MSMKRCAVVSAILWISLVYAHSGLKSSGLGSPDSCKPLVVAHRGASGYVPEHTLGSYALAVTMGADYIEPDVVMTRDGHLIARHENELSLTTDVNQHPEFATRQRTKTVDGRTMSGWFSEDFTLAEIKTLRAKELMPTFRVGNTRMDGSFEVPTIQEIIDLAKGLEISEGRLIGIYPEIKHGLYFQRLGLSMEKPLTDLLHANGYGGADSPVYIQSFEINNLKELKTLTDLKLLQLIAGDVSRQPFDQFEAGSNITYGHMTSAAGLREIATYATAVSPDKRHIIPTNADGTLGNPTNFVQDAHAAGLLVHPYTFRAENVFLPVEFRSDDTSIEAIGDSRGEMRVFLQTGIDGLFTDQPDILVDIREPCSYSNSSINVRPVVSVYMLLSQLIIAIAYFRLST